MTKPEAPATPAKKRTPRKKPGQHNLHVSISDAMFEQLEKSADGRPINVWLSKLVERHFDSFKLE